MSSRLTCASSSPSRVLSLLTAAILMAGSAPLLAAAATEQTPRNMGDYSFAIAQQPLVSALNAFTTVTGWQVGFSPLSLKSRAAVVALHGQEDEVDHRAEDAPPRLASLLCAPCSGA